MNRTLLTISHFDSSGATGIGADLKTFQTYRVYGAAAATAIVAQNTQGIQGLHPVSMELVGQQVEAVAGDMQVHGVKVGSLVTEANVKIVASLLSALDLKKLVVVDPTVTSSTGERLMEEPALGALKDQILPMASMLTVNCEEAEALSGRTVEDVGSAKEASLALHEMGCREVVVTSVGFDGPRAMDLWFDGKNHHIVEVMRVQTHNTLGMGDTFSAILAALLAKGTVTGEAIDRAKKYVGKASQHPFQIGKGKGPLNHSIPM